MAKIAINSLVSVTDEACVYYGHVFLVQGYSTLTRSYTCKPTSSGPNQEFLASQLRTWSTIKYGCFGMSEDDSND